MAKIRVLRLLEYTYDSVERMEEDMRHWLVQGNFNGANFKSVILPLEVLDGLPDEEATG